MSPLLATVEQVDARLDAARAAMEQAGQLLFDVDRNPMRQVLESSSLSGMTAAAWAEMPERLAALWTTYLAASDVLAEADRQRGTKRRLADAELTGLADLLTGPAVALPTPGFDQGAPGPVTLDEALSRIGPACETLAVMLARVREAWGQLGPSLDQLDGRLDALETSATAGGIRIPNDAAVARRQVVATRDRLAHDPMSMQLSDLEPITAGVVRAEQGSAAAAQGRAELADRVADALQALEQANDLLQAAGAVAAEAAEKIRAGEASQTVDRDLGALARDLAGLRGELRAVAERAGTDGQDTERHLARLGNRPATLLAEAERLHAAAGAGLAARRELRGRLEAYRAKAMRIGEAEDLALEAIYQRARDMLYVAPCDLVGAGGLVAAYQRAISPPTRPHPGETAGSTGMGAVDEADGGAG